MEVPFVARAPELKRILGLAEGLRAGRGGALLVLGEAGVGKTRLLREALAGMGSLPLDVAYASALGRGETEKFFLFREALGRLADRRRGGEAAAEGAPLPAGAFLGEETPGDRRALRRTVSACKGRPLLILSRDSPPVLRRHAEVGDARILWLTTVEGPDHIAPANLDKLNDQIEQFQRNHVNAVVFLSGLEFLALHAKFAGVLRLVQSVRDQSLATEGTLVIATAPGAFPPEEMARLSGDFEPLFPEAATAPQARHLQEMSEIMDNVERMAKERPFVLVLDDFQWADSGSLELFGLIATLTSDLPTLLVASARSEELEGEPDGRPGVEGILGQLTRQDLLPRLSLPRLDREEADHLIDVALGRNALPEGFYAQIFQTCQGNPLQTLETIRLLREEGALVAKPMGWTLSRELDTISVPSKVSDVIQGRLQRLSHDLRDVLEAASCVGDRFEPSLVADALGRPEADVLRVLNRLTRSRGLILSDEDQFRFDPTLVRRVVYASLAPGLRKSYHRALARVFEDRGLGRLDPGRVAHHLLAAGEVERGREATRQAALLARARYDNREAERHLRRWVALSEGQIPPGQLAKGLTSLGDVLTVAGSPQALASYDRAISLLPPGPERAGILAREVWLLNFLGRAEEAARKTDEGLAMVAPGTAPWAYLMTRRAQTWMHTRPPMEALRRMEEILPQVRAATGDTLALEQLLIMHANAAVMAYDPSRARPSLAESLAIARKRSDMLGVALSLILEAAVGIQTEDFREAEARGREAWDLADMMGDRISLSFALTARALAYLARGDTTSLRPLAERGVRMWKGQANTPASDTGRVLLSAVDLLDHRVDDPSGAHLLSQIEPSTSRHQLWIQAFTLEGIGKALKQGGLSASAAAVSARAKEFYARVNQA